MVRSRIPKDPPTRSILFRPSTDYEPMGLVRERVSRFDLPGGGVWSIKGISASPPSSSPAGPSPTGLGPYSVTLMGLRNAVFSPSTGPGDRSNLSHPGPVSTLSGPSTEEASRGLGPSADLSHPSDSARRLITRDRYSPDRSAPTTPSGRQHRVGPISGYLSPVSSLRTSGI